MTTLDWSLVFGYLALTLGIGLLAARRASRGGDEFFLSGRELPWWWLGISMVATTFSTDTPNLVADITRTHGVSGNWVWWCFLLTGMMTVFLYARLWRRSGIVTDLAFYEIRYSGPAAAFLRGFRAIYLGVFFNLMILAAVTLAAIKIGGVLLGLSPIQTVTVAAVVTVTMSAASGLRGVVLTDALLFVVAMGGSLMAAHSALSHPKVGGLAGLMSHPEVLSKRSLLPSFDNPEVFVPLLLIPLAVQWWAAWYPGAEPGGGGYITQRMLAAPDETQAMKATLLFNALHYALRPWPWILVALASLIVYPDLESIAAAYPTLSSDVIGHDLAYPAMLATLPPGALGLVVASLAAAYMSTVSTHLNWGASYIVHDVWCRFVDPETSPRKQVLLGRIATVGLMLGAATLALQLTNALQAFQLLLQIGAGTGLLFILRWYWWRINAWSEVAAMTSSFVIAWVFAFGDFGLEAWQELLLGVAITTACWLIATFATRPTDPETLSRFVSLVGVSGPGWPRSFTRSPSLHSDSGAPLSKSLTQMFLGSTSVYAALFATGLWLYGDGLRATVAALVCAAATAFLARTFAKRA